MKRQRRRFWNIVIASTAAALLAAGCANNGAPGSDSENQPDTNDTQDASAESDDVGDAKETIRVAYMVTGSSLPMYVAADKYADEVGINLEMTQVSGNEGITGVATGEFDIGLAGIGSATYNAVDEGLPVAYVAPMHAGYLEDYFIISSQYASSQEEAAELAQDMSHLAGETFAVDGPGVVTEALLNQALNRVGLSLEEVTLEYIPFPDQVTALANGSIVGGILSEPFPTQAEESEAGYRPWDTPDSDPQPFTGILYNTDWAQANPELATQYMEAYSLAAKDLAESGWDSPEMLSILEDNTGFDPDLIASARQHHIPADLSVDLDFLKENYQSFYLEQGSLNYDSLIDESEVWDFTWRDQVSD